MAIEKSLGISLGSTRLGDSSQIVSFLTQDFGLIKCVARGSRRKRNRFGNALEPFMLSSIVFYYRPKRDLFTLSQADVSRFYPAIRADLVKMATAQIPIDLLKRVLLPADSEAHFFNLTRIFLDELADSPDDGQSSILLRFFMGFCRAYGFAIDFRHCKRCGKVGSRMTFDLRRGSVYCGECRDHSAGRPIPDSVFRILNSASLGNADASNDTGSLLYALRLLCEYLTHHSERKVDLASVAFLESILTTKPLAKKARQSMTDGTC